MTISLTPETQTLLDEKLKSGLYHSADEVVHAALEALDEIESYQLTPEIQTTIDRAEDQIEAGQVHEWSQVKESIRAKFLGQ